VCLVTTGRNRFVVLTKRYAVKFPALRSWRDFLFGLLNNLNERQAHREDPAHRCPVLFVAPGGFLLVMPRVKELTEDEFRLHGPAKRFHDRRYQPEAKPDSWGRSANGEIVAIDYGW
jgi:hypothetical protein